MQFTSPLTHGTLIRRYKRFLADVRLDDGTIVTAHCTNSGSMKCCIEEDAEVYLSPAADPKRKTPFTWEMIRINGKWVGINTSNPNLLVYEAIKNRSIAGLNKYDRVTREVKFDESRLDVLAENDTERCAIEVKNVTMKDGDAALFPDARTERGLKHLHTLIRLKSQGLRAVMVYVIQRTDVTVFGTADSIDPDYANGLKEAMAAGVEVFPIQAVVSPEGIELGALLPFVTQ
ncbi:sugar fermentation stimulation protein A [Breznakibacter xylanolyticus]|uniref:Sugar fermentation stimulation protein homolog n=1 Tax=Breznakibacter xylanolyticus TaxID=990 RepID=A0A2W7NJ08_9BACT|nr:DNA/RNA nuclease SfsA [Breznakibacter xylanolyticus]PZX20405.1 sugar fermentation stimulation protein A [Breznakibacter xylanolyticus]